jgi:hypothetical protein
MAQFDDSYSHRGFSPVARKQQLKPETVLNGFQRKRVAVTPG